MNREQSRFFLFGHVAATPCGIRLTTTCEFSNQRPVIYANRGVSFYDTPLFPLFPGIHEPDGAIRHKIIPASLRTW